MCNNIFDPFSLSLTNEIEIFKISHKEMEQKWKEESDYALGMIKNAYCSGCYDSDCTLEKKEWVVVQVGAYRFGLDKVGVCLDCIDCFLNELKTPYHMDIPFTSSDDIHTVNFTAHRLDNLFERKEPIGKSEPEQPLTENCKKRLHEILEKNFEIIERSKKEQEKHYSCKDCKKLVGIDLTQLKYTNHFRTATLMGHCLGCSALLKVSKGCSMAPCPCCVSNTKTCVVCMEGATPLVHDLKSCSELADKALKNPKSTFLFIPEMESCICGTDNFESWDLSSYTDSNSLRTK